MASNGQLSSGAPANPDPASQAQQQQAKSQEGVQTGASVSTMDNAKATEYVKELLKEKIIMDPTQCPNAMRLIDEEVVKAQTKGKVVKESRYVDIYREKPVRVAVKVLVPVKEHPRFNFVGKLLGPKGNSLKRLQEETMTRMAILGRGSMRDKQKEEECRNTLDPKYSHLSDELHVEIVALAPPAEAHARIAYALAEIRKYLVPDNNDEIRMEQLREIQASSGGGGGGGGGGAGGGGGSLGGGPAMPGGRGRGRAGALVPRAPIPRGGMMGAGPMGGPPLLPRPMPGKTKVLSILDRARVAMEESYNEYEEPGYYEPPAPGPGFGGDFNGGAGDYYDSGYSDGSAGRWKGYKSSAGGGASRFGTPRATPYTRPAK